MEFNLTLYNKLRWNFPNLLTYRRFTSGAKHMKARLNSYATIVFTCALLLAARNISASTVYAATANQSDVSAAIIRAADGDTVVIPVGTVRWTTGVAITKGVTLRGAGTGHTIIKDGAASAPLIDWTLKAGYVSRMTGIQFQDGGRTPTASEPTGTIAYHGEAGDTFDRQIRVDHCYFNQINGTNTFLNCIGVVDHNQFDKRQGVGAAMYCEHNAWNNGTYGDLSWTSPTNFGGSNFMFVEDNVFNPTPNGLPNNLDIGYGGSRIVIRHNVFNGNSKVVTHGTDTSKRRRGVRAMEIYRNIYHGVDGGNSIGDLRSGILLFHDNQIDGYNTHELAYDLKIYRMFAQSWLRWGIADGTNAFDVNTPGGPFYLGTAATNSVDQTVRLGPDPGWTSNRWLYYSLKRATDLGATGTKNASRISGNTHNIITWQPVADPTQGRTMKISAGDSVQIWKVKHALDQPGRCRGSQITAYLPVPPAGWPPNDQVTEPCYSWNNTQNVTQRVNFAAMNPIRQGEHYFNDTQMPGYTEYTYPHPLTFR